LLSGTFNDFQRFKLKHEKLLSTFAFNLNLRHYSVETQTQLSVARSMTHVANMWRKTAMVGWRKLNPG